MYAAFTLYTHAGDTKAQVPSELPARVGDFCILRRRDIREPQDLSEFNPVYLVRLHLLIYKVDFNSSTSRGTWDLTHKRGE